MQPPLPDEQSGRGAKKKSNARQWPANRKESSQAKSCRLLLDIFTVVVDLSA